MAIFLVAYFIFHAMEGRRGVFVLETIESNTVVAQKKLERLKSERIRLAQVARGLHPETLDKDLVDQFARQNLGTMNADEIVVIIAN